jgi:leader peptidase (prepilin peptidase) / N-methyltransferase
MFEAASFDPPGGFDTIAWSAVVVAPAIGSFLGVVIRRLPEGQPITCARSRCQACNAVLGPRDLVPILSWLAARGRCRRCGHRVSWFYPAVELAALAIAVVAALLDRGVEVWLDCIFGWWLLTLAWIDARHWLLPDLLTLPLVLAGLFAAWLFDRGDLANRALGAALGYAAFRVVAYLYRQLRGRDGLGEGDAKLLAAAGAWVGASGLPQVILFAALAGLGAAVCLRLSGVRLGALSALPFGPFLAFAAWFVWLLPAAYWFG